MAKDYNPESIVTGPWQSGNGLISTTGSKRREMERISMGNYIVTSAGVT